MRAPDHAPKRETITRPLDPAKIAWQWGHDAAQDGYPECACPFHVGSLSANQWFEGYAAGLGEQPHD